MVDLVEVKDFRDFCYQNKTFIQDKYSEASEACNTTREFKPDFDMFQKLIDLGSVTIFEIYEEEVFVGYASVTTCPALLHRNKVDATIDHIALDKDKRGKGTARTVINLIEDLLKERGVDEVKLVIPCTEMHDLFADKLSYKKAVTTHIKRLN